MTYALVVAPWLLMLVLVWMLLAGQPAGQADLLAQNASLRATTMAYPTPTRIPPVWCNYGTSYVACAPDRP